MNFRDIPFGMATSRFARADKSGEVPSGNGRYPYADIKRLCIAPEVLTIAETTRAFSSISSNSPLSSGCLPQTGTRTLSLI